MSPGTPRAAPPPGTPVIRPTATSPLVVLILVSPNLMEAIVRHKPVAKLSRGLGLPLTEKAVKYFERRPYPPGPHGRGRRNQSPYKLRLLEKQRLRFQYHISEKQLRRAFEEADRGQGRTGHLL